MKRIYILQYMILIFIIISCTKRSPTNRTIKDTIVENTFISDSLEADEAIKDDWPKGKMLRFSEFYQDNLGNFLARQRGDRLGSHLGYVLLEPQEFTGTDVPFLCYTSKEISQLYVDNKKVRLTKGKEFFFRQKIKLYSGFNRIPIKIINNTGDTTETHLDMNMARTQE